MPQKLSVFMLVRIVAEKGQKDYGNRYLLSIDNRPLAKVRVEMRQVGESEG